MVTRPVIAPRTLIISRFRMAVKLGIGQNYRIRALSQQRHCLGPRIPAGEHTMSEGRHSVLGPGLSTPVGILGYLLIRVATQAVSLLATV